MSTTTPVTAEQLISLSAHQGRCELIAGELREMSPSGWKHGMILGRLHTLLGRHVEDHQLGVVLGAETGFLIGRDPDTVRTPDVAFLANEHLHAVEPAEAYWPGPPDLAVEVLSPSDSKREVDDKIQAWLTSGAHMVWVVDPQSRSVTVCKGAAEVHVKAASDVLDGGDVVAGFRCPVAAFFEFRQ